MQNLLNRKSKISFLDGLVNGKHTIQDLRDKHLRINVDMENGTKYFCNEKEITEEEFAEILATIPPGKIEFKVSFCECFIL